MSLLSSRVSRLTQSVLALLILAAILRDGDAACPRAAVRALASSLKKAEAPKGKCVATFKGESLSFDACRTGLEGGLDVYWKIEGDIIRTLFSAESKGWVGLGWGATKMVPGAATVAYVDPASGGASVKDFTLSAKSADGVTPGSSQKLSNADAELAGDRIVAMFSRPLGDELAGDKPASAIWAVGPSVSAGGALDYHSARGVEEFDLFNWTEGGTVGKNQSVDGGDSPSFAEEDANSDKTSRHTAETTASSASASKSDSCNVTFGGDEMDFRACRLGLEGDINVYWNIDETKKTVKTLFSTPSEKGYIGWGWGLQNMVPGSAAVARVNANGKPTLAAYALTGKSSDAVKQDPGAIDISDGAAEISGGFLKGLFTQPLSSGVSNGPTNAIWARGDTSGGAAGLAHHSTRGVGTLDLSARTDAGDARGVKLARVFVIHGVLMVVAWLLLAPAGIFVMRYLKKYNPTAFYAHLTLMTLTFVLVVSAYGLAMWKGNHVERTHMWIGTFATFGATAQVICGAMRPAKGHQLRRTFVLLHSNIGRVAWVLAVVNIFIGLRIADADRWAYIICSAAVGVFLLLMVIFQFLSKQFPTKDTDIREPSNVAESA